MVFELMLISLSFIFLSIASYEDLKTREVPDFLNYIFIALGIFIRILWFLFEKDIFILTWMPIAVLTLGGFSYLLFISGQWGGGDVKVMLGISTMLSSFKNEVFPFFFNFLFNTFIVGALYGIFWIFLITLKNTRKIKFKSYEKALLSFILISIPLFYVLSYLQKAIAFFVAFLFISIVSIVYFKKIEKKAMEKYVTVDKLTVGDWLVNNIKIGSKVIIKRRNIGLTIEDIKKIKKYGIRKVKIKVGVPFVPTFLISFIVTLVFGNLLLMIYQ